MGWPKRILVLSFVLFILSSLAVISFSDKQIPASFFGGQEIYSPGDWIKEEQIKVYKDRIILDIKNASWSGFTDTNSMDPFIDKESNAIEIMPQGPEAINVGDVISYQTSYGILIHRVIEKGKDSKGTYYTVKGDNNRFKDPFKIRFPQVKGVVVAVIY